MDARTLDRTLGVVRSTLLNARAPDGYWVGELSSSALATATAVVALAVADRAAAGAGLSAPVGGRSPLPHGILPHEGLIRNGLDWLARHVNPDGGWGDTVRSASNISTTALAWAAFGAAGDLAGATRDAAARAESWLAAHAGGRQPGRLAEAIARRYGKDRTFSIPILTACALAGRLGEGRGAWRHVRPLPFEYAACPPSWFRWLRLPVVSYALPALIAVGQARHHHRPSWDPVARLLRGAARGRTLRVLESIQPATGGFLEAVPLTSFVVMSLAGSGAADHPVVSRGVAFLVRSVRLGGSWPIDTNLATWVTTLSVNALAVGGGLDACLSEEERPAILRWLLAQQNRAVHPYTQAAPGGWAWTDLAGGVPDADDTAGALLALRNLGPREAGVPDAAAAGAAWLLDLQNGDGGVPTFCRGWGTLPFDRSGADLTAHALRALAAWRDDLPEDLRPRVDRFVRQAVAFLGREQDANGSWAPLWFGNERAPGEKNPTHGTSRVLLALSDAAAAFAIPGVTEMAAGGAAWLLKAQNPDGGWGGAPGIPSTLEETALAVEALAAFGGKPGAAPAPSADALKAAVSRGADWLAEHGLNWKALTPSPLGFYFANLWYFEKLYPLIFASAALARAQRLIS